MGWAGKLGNMAATGRPGEQCSQPASQPLPSTHPRTYPPAWPPLQALQTALAQPHPPTHLHRRVAPHNDLVLAVAVRADQLVHVLGPRQVAHLAGAGVGWDTGEV